MIEVCSRYKNSMIQLGNRIIAFHNGIAIVTEEDAKLLITKPGYFLKHYPLATDLSKAYSKPDRLSKIIFSISIVCYNNIETTRRCIKFIQESLKHNYELIITDNSSSDGTREYLKQLKKKESNITIISNKKNLGFILPNIKALEGAKGKYFILLNNDMFIEDPLWLIRLLEAFERDSSVKIAGPVSCRLGSDGCGRGCTENYDYIEGSCLAIPTEFAKAIGLFDTKLYSFAYNEDSDLNLRVRERGYQVKRVSIRYTHHQGTTTKKNLSSLRPIAEKNRVNFYTRWELYLKKRIFREPLSLSHLSSFDRKRFMLSRRAVLAREVGLGDVLFFSTAASWLKRLNPKCHLTFATKRENYRILKDNPFIDEIVDYAEIGNETFSRKFDYGLHFVPFYRNTELVEGDELRDHSIEIIQRFFRAKVWDPTIYYSVTFEEREWAKSHLNRQKGKKIVSIVLSSQDPKRDHPNILGVAKLFYQKGLQVVLLNKDRINHKVEGAINLTGFTSISNAAAIIEQSDLIIAPDTGLLHIAGVLKKNILTWSVSFPSKVRMKYYSNYFAFELWEDCQYGPCRFSHDYYCRDKICFKALAPEVLYEKALELKYL